MQAPQRCNGAQLCDETQRHAHCAGRILIIYGALCNEILKRSLRRDMGKTCRGALILLTSLSARRFCGRFFAGFFMRRNWLTVLLFALALAVQAIAPAAANVAMAKAGASRAAVELCASAADAGDRQQAPSRLHHHRDACPLCQAYCDGVAPLVSRSLATGLPPVLWTAQFWTTANRTLPTPHSEYSWQARAPPSYS